MSLVSAGRQSGRLIGSLVAVGSDFRGMVWRSARGDDGIFYDAERKEVSGVAFNNAVRSVGRLVAVSLCRTRFKVVFHTMPNGLWFDGEQVSRNLECPSCGAVRSPKGFGEMIGYCASCLAAD